jgi:N-acetylglucosamine-6-sulfatase
MVAIGGVPICRTRVRGKRTKSTARLLVSVATAVLLASTLLLVTVIDSLTLMSPGVERPNIIFVLTDDQFPGTENEMPALKNNITSKGIEFTNTISTFPLCCPARATILRGQYPHNTHIYGNSLPRGGWEKFHGSGLQDSTIATWLHDDGYRTGLFGKYLNGYIAPGIPPGWDRWHAWNGPKQGWTAINDQGGQKPLKPQEADSDTSDAALRFLGSHLGRGAPVFAFVSFGAEHSPYHYARADTHEFEGVGVPRTPAFNEADVSDKPSYVSDLPQLSEKKVAQMDQDYANGLRSLMGVDYFIQKASDLLRSKGEMGNTYFVFYTDNGDHFGQHRLTHGKLQPYQEDTDFPLIVRGPGIPHGETNGDLIGNHDIAPTLARMGGANVPAFVDGRSFLPLAKDHASTWARTALLSGRETDAVPSDTWEMLRMGGSNYTRYEDGEKEYYDLRLDPYQLHNALGHSDTTYPPPDPAIRSYYERRLDALHACSGHEGPRSCRDAEDAPLLPSGGTP